MEAYLPFIVVGLTAGAVYGLAAVGLVLTYKTSGVFNFAHGAIGMFATFVFFSMRSHIPTALAAIIAVVVIGPAIGLIVDRLLLRRLAGATAATYVVVSIGLLVALQGLAIAVYGGRMRAIAPLFPRTSYRIPGLNVTYEQTWVVAISVVAVVGLTLFFRLTKLGLQTRAVVEDGDLAELERVDSRLVTSFSWMLGCAFASLSGILIAPLIGLDAAVLTLLVVQAFAAAVVGRLTHIWATFVGAVGIGVAAALTTKLAVQHPGLTGLPTSLPFIVLFAVLIASPKGWFVAVTKERVVGQRTRRREAERRAPWALIAAGAAVAAALPMVLNSARLLTARTTLIFILIFASLSLVVGLSRQVTLCHVTFLAFGAVLTARLESGGIPFVVAMLIAATLTVPVGALLAIPAIRLSGLFLALATFGFAILAQYLLYPSELGFGQAAIVILRRPSFLAGDNAYYYFTLAVVLLGVIGAELVRVNRLGRTLRALADSPVAVESIGLNPMLPRVLVFSVSAFLAAICGALLGAQAQRINPYNFDFSQSLIWLAVIVVGGVATLGGSTLAAVLFVAVPAILTQPVVTEYQPVFFGVAAMLLAQTPNGLAGLMRSVHIDLEGLVSASRWRLAASPWRERGVVRLPGAET